MKIFSILGMLLAAFQNQEGENADASARESESDLSYVRWQNGPRLDNDRHLEEKYYAPWVEKKLCRRCRQLQDYTNQQRYSHPQESQPRWEQRHRDGALRYYQYPQCFYNPYQEANTFLLDRNVQPQDMIDKSMGLPGAQNDSWEFYDEDARYYEQYHAQSQPPQETSQPENAPVTHTKIIYAKDYSVVSPKIAAKILGKQDDKDKSKASGSQDEDKKGKENKGKKGKDDNKKEKKDEKKDKKNDEEENGVIGTTIFAALSAVVVAVFLI